MQGIEGHRLELPRNWGNRKIMRIQSNSTRDQELKQIKRCSKRYDLQICNGLYHISGGEGGFLGSLHLEAYLIILKLTEISMVGRFSMVDQHLSSGSFHGTALETQSDIEANGRRRKTQLGL